MSATSMMILLFTYLTSLQATNTDKFAAEVLNRHVEYMGGTSALKESGDWKLEGTKSSGGQPGVWSLQLRHTPFALRERVSGDGVGKQPFLLSDGDLAWELDEGIAPHPVTGLPAATIIEKAFFWRRAYLDINIVEASRSQPQEIRVMDDEGNAGAARACVALRFRTPIETVWRLEFDAKDGRLHCAIEEPGGRDRWIQFGRWRSFGPIRIATMWIEGAKNIPFVTITSIDNLTTNIELNPGLYLGRPGGNASRKPPFMGAKLEVVPTSVPGAAQYILQMCRMNGGNFESALFDTGVTVPSIDARAAGNKPLPMLKKEMFSTPSGPMEEALAWVDLLDVGRESFYQFPASQVKAPYLPSLTEFQQPLMILGGERIMRATPILDIKNGSLHFRGNPAARLGEVDGAESKPQNRFIITIPLDRLRPGSPVPAVVMEARVGVAAAPSPDVKNLVSLRMMLDTGFHTAIALRPSGLRKLGLPVGRKEWKERGALEVKMGPNDKNPSTDLLVELPEFRLGSIRFERPWVELTGLDLPDDPAFDGYLGGGALITFNRAGIDIETKILELEPGGEMRHEGNDWVVPWQGKYFGFVVLTRGGGGAATRPATPIVCNVFERSAAEHAGIQINDRLLTIDGTACDDLSMQQIVRRLWWREARELALELARPDGTRYRAALR
ncbi:MAG: hypothetical protein HY286_08685 [Planctomycetes bacterium]|nr:hypothetical protein [Planctomycetota bacterium]